MGEWEALDKGEPPDADLIQAKLGLLEEMAHHFFPDEVLSNDRLHQFLWRPKRGYMRGLDDVDPLKQWLRPTNTTVPKALCQDGILLPCGGANALQFLHLTFQEYLTACALARHANNEGWHTVADLWRQGQQTCRHPLEFVIQGDEALARHNVVRHAEDGDFRY